MPVALRPAEHDNRTSTSARGTRWTLRAVAPPLVDYPVSTGFVDESTEALFSVDSFGALLPERTENAGDVPLDALAGEMAMWAMFDSPWCHLVDRELFGGVLAKVRPRPEPDLLIPLTRRQHIARPLPGHRASGA